MLGDRVQNSRGQFTVRRGQYNASERMEGIGVNTYSEGYTAFHNGIDRNCNPWVEGGREWREWFEGWDAAARSQEY